MFDELFEEQPRWFERVLGVVAALTGVLGLGVIAWIGVKEPRSPYYKQTLIIFAGGALVSIYSLVIARRLLRSQRPRHLLSGPALIILGIFVGIGGVIPWLALRELRGLAVDGLVLGLAATVLGIRRLHHPSGPKSNDLDAA